MLPLERIRVFWARVSPPDCKSDAKAVKVRIPLVPTMNNINNKRMAENTVLQHRTAETPKDFAAADYMKC